MREKRSNCPLAKLLDIIGDKWTLLVLRDIMFFKKYTFKELSQMDENIATNTLADRLQRLVNHKFITKTQSETNKIVSFYHPTPIINELMPVIMNLGAWSKKNLFTENEMATSLE